ncbi:MAG: hypothetical protein ABIH38_05060 [Patescibacteria group bacterium]
MTLIIDLSKPEPKLILKDGRKEIASHSWAGLCQLSETLISEIDKFLKKNKVSLDDLGKIEVVESKDSMVSTRIAQAVALGLKVKID